MLVCLSGGKSTSMADMETYKPQVDKLVEQCKLGSTYSKVASVDVQREAVGEKFLDFEIRR